MTLGGVGAEHDDAAGADDVVADRGVAAEFGELEELVGEDFGDAHGSALLGDLGDGTTGALAVLGLLAEEGGGFVEDEHDVGHALGVEVLLLELAGEVDAVVDEGFGEEEGSHGAVFAEAGVGGHGLDGGVGGALGVGVDDDGAGEVGGEGDELEDAAFAGAGDAGDVEVAGAEFGVEELGAQGAAGDGCADAEVAAG
ncbi:hypothetical protein KJK32_47070 (plasmid) [Streptomyces sp. JCM17656]|nr:hypothetical protein KJK32_47070 [Streptomyces sp. JCM17656]